MKQVCDVRWGNVSGHRTCMTKVPVPIPGRSPLSQDTNFVSERCHEVYLKPSTVMSHGDGAQTVRALQSRFPDRQLKPMDSTIQFPEQLTRRREALRIHEGLSWNFGPDIQLLFLAAHCLCFDEHAATGFCIVFKVCVVSRTCY